MTIDRMLSGLSISASGMAAERTRMEVIANNMANAHTTRGPDGKAFKRQQVIFQTVIDATDHQHGMGGVEVVAIAQDDSAHQRIHQPNHPDADEEGFVTLPNVKPAFEMVDMLTASRSYEANLRALRSFREMAEQSLELLRAR